MKPPMVAPDDEPVLDKKNDLDCSVEEDFKIPENVKVFKKLNHSLDQLMDDGYEVEDQQQLPEPLQKQQVKEQSLQTQLHEWQQQQKTLHEKQHFQKLHRQLQEETQQKLQERQEQEYAQQLQQIQQQQLLNLFQQQIPEQQLLYYQYYQQLSEEQKLIYQHWLEHQQYAYQQATKKNQQQSQSSEDLRAVISHIVNQQQKTAYNPIPTAYTVGPTPVSSPATPITSENTLNESNNINRLFTPQGSKNSGTPIKLKGAKSLSPLERQLYQMRLQNSNLPLTPPRDASPIEKRKINPDKLYFSTPNRSSLVTPPNSPQTYAKLQQAMNIELQDTDYPVFQNKIKTQRTFHPMVSFDYPRPNFMYSKPLIDPLAVERAAQLHHSVAAVSEASCTWSGHIPIQNHKNPVYSCKVFLGGVPWDITDSGLQGTFGRFGNFKIEWPGKDGYVYLLFETERSVRNLLENCTLDHKTGSYYHHVSSRRMRSKQIQVIPWVIADSNKTFNPDLIVESRKTVFVGALHGMITAEALGSIMNDLFGKVIYAGIDTDKHKYPIGSGRVTFSSYTSYTKAVHASFVEVKTPKFTKKLQIDPYIEETLCSYCAHERGNYFCRDWNCFKYFCADCWYLQHADQCMRHHQPIARSVKKNCTDV